MVSAYCLNVECEFHDISEEDNYCAPEEVSNSCEESEWSDEEVE